MAGIVSYGTYIPKYRIKREEIAKAWGGHATGENSAAYLNEDIYTMAAEASSNAIECSAIDREYIDAIYLATDSAPYIEHTLVRAIGDILRLREDLDVADFAASPRAGATALKACLDAINSGRIRYGLVIAADCRPFAPGSPEEMAFGAGAAAYILGPVGTTAEVETIHTYSTYFLDRWRPSEGRFTQTHEPRFTREYGYSAHVINAAKGFMEKANLTMADFQHVVCQQPPEDRLLKSIARTLSISSQQMGAPIGPSIGDAGAASTFLSLATALDKAKPKERILALFYGTGISDALNIVVNNGTEQPKGAERSIQYYLDNKEYIDYLTLAKLKGNIDTAEKPAKMWVTPTSPIWWRDGVVLRRLLGARCRQCGYVNFPPTLRRICIRCGNTSFDEVLLSRKGRVHTYCVNIYVPHGLESPLPVIIADMDDGVRYKGLGTEMKLEEIEVGTPVELVWRKIGSEDSVNAYSYVFRTLK